MPPIPTRDHQQFLANLQTSPSRPLSNPLEISGQAIFQISYQKGATPGVEAPITPDVVDAVDAGDVLQGFGVDSLASSASGCWHILSPVCGSHELFGYRHPQDGSLYECPQSGTTT